MIEPRQREIDALHAKLFPPQPGASEQHAPGVSLLSDDEVIEKAMQDDDFKELWEGGLCGKSTPSEAAATLSR